MAYNEAQINPVAPPSLLADSSRTIERLAEIHNRVMKLGDMLHGSMPREAGGKASPPEPAPAVRRNLDRIHALVCDIDSELSRIESKL